MRRAVNQLELRGWTETSYMKGLGVLNVSEYISELDRLMSATLIFQKALQPSIVLFDFRPKGKPRPYNLAYRTTNQTRERYAQLAASSYLKLRIREQVLPLSDRHSLPQGD